MEELFKNVPKKDESKKDWLAKFNKITGVRVNPLLFTIKSYSDKPNIKTLKETLDNLKKDLNIKDFDSLGLYKIYLVLNDKSLKEFHKIEKKEILNFNHHIKDVFHIH